MAPVHFWREPLRYIHWAARAKPAIFWSLCVGSIGPIMMVRVLCRQSAHGLVNKLLQVVVPPIRHRMGDGPRPQIPMTYPST